MKGFFLAGVALGALIAPAVGADMLVKAPVPVDTWTGWYVGVNAGYASSSLSDLADDTTIRV